VLEAFRGIHSHIFLVFILLVQFLLSITW